MPASVVPPQLRGRPFTWAEAQAAGLTKHHLRTSAFRHVFRTVWACADLPDTRATRVSAVRLILPPQGVLVSLTAAWLHGADVRRDDDLDVHVGFPPGRRVRRRPGLVVTQETLAPGDVGLVDGLPVTSPTRTVFDALRLLRDPEGVVVADALTHLRLVDVPDLRRYFDGQRRLRNLRVGERLLDDVDPLAESPMETRARVRIVRAGLPRPVAQLDVYDPAGRHVGRLDLAYPDRKVAIEYDGAWHWHHRRHDDRRRDRLRELGWTVIVVSAEDLYAGDDAWIGRVARALRRPAA